MSFNSQAYDYKTIRAKSSTYCTIRACVHNVFSASQHFFPMRREPREKTLPPAFFFRALDFFVQPLRTLLVENIWTFRLTFSGNQSYIRWGGTHHPCYQENWGEACSGHVCLSGALWYVRQKLSKPRRNKNNVKKIDPFFVMKHNVSQRWPPSFVGLFFNSWRKCKFLWTMYNHSLSGTVTVT